MNYEDFRLETLKARTKKQFEVSNSYGAKDAYRWCIKNKLIDRSVSESDFRKIINGFNQHLQDQLMSFKDVNLPLRMGKIEIRKFNTYVKLKDGKVKTNRSIDWDKTLKLWAEDEESRELKTLIRHEASEKFIIQYNKKYAKYNNKTYYKFIPTRSLKIRLKELIKNNEFDAFITKR